MERHELKEALAEVFQERSAVDAETHREHHMFLGDCIPLLREFLQQRRERQAKWDEIKSTALGTAVVAVVGSTLSALAWIGHLVLKALESGGGQQP